MVSFVIQMHYCEEYLSTGYAYGVSLLNICASHWLSKMNKEARAVA